jgi:hypothetical protein
MTYQAEQYQKISFFKKFLIQRGALIKFYRNIIDHNRHANLLDYPLLDDMEESINYAFTWSDTPEGHNFWAILDDRWRNLCDSNHYMCL